MKIGVMGLAFGSTNKGCEALGYGFFNVLQICAQRRDTTFYVDIFGNCDVKKIYKNGNFDRLICRSLPMPGFGSVEKIRYHLHIYGSEDIVFDFTAGDSFSDIYGMERFVRRTVAKVLAIKSKTHFVLGSQTYGPYKSLFAKYFAGYVMRNSYKVFARDTLSCKQVKAVSGVSAVQTVDVAFAMQYTYTPIHSKKTIVGFNPSGLLWSGGYTHDNQFSLKVDYPAYCREVIRKLLEDSRYEIVLIPHVLEENLRATDNDMVACEALMKEFPQLKISPFFDSPVEAKSFISGVDVFTGARMHATIAAFATGVPVLPFSYSPKFEGLFGSMGYTDIVSGKEASTKLAVEKTLDFIEKHSEKKERMEQYQLLIDEGIQFLLNETDRILQDCKK